MQTNTVDLNAFARERFCVTLTLTPWPWKTFQQCPLSWW